MKELRTADEMCGKPLLLLESRKFPATSARLMLLILPGDDFEFPSALVDWAAEITDDGKDEVFAMQFESANAADSPLARYLTHRTFNVNFSAALQTGKIALTAADGIYKFIKLEVEPERATMILGILRGVSWDIYNDPSPNFPDDFSVDIISEQ